MRTPSLVILLTAALTLLTACGGLLNVPLEPMNLRRIAIAAAPEANEGQPIPVDIVFAKDEETLRDLEGFAAFGWWTVKQNDLGDWEERAAVESLEVLPGAQTILTDLPAAGRGAVGVVIYAHYGNQQLNRLVFINVAAIDLTLTDMGPQAENGRPYVLTSPPETSQPRR